MKIYKLVIYISWIFAFASCSGSGIRTQLASESLVEQRVFCNPIKENGFDGILAVNTNENNWIHQTESTILQFKDVPDHFKSIDHSYIQLFSFSYQKNKMLRATKPLEIDVYNLDTHTLVQTVEYIDHNLINRGDDNVDEFFFDHIFVIKDTVGWQGLLLGLFNDIDKPIIPLSKILNPPFDANPHVYMSRHVDNPQLSDLHPFRTFLTTTEEDDPLFLSKALDACLSLSGVSFDFYTQSI